MRFIDVRELAELALGALLGMAVIWLLARPSPSLLHPALSPHQWRLVGIGAGIFVAITWSAWQVDRRIDRRIPAYRRTPPSFRDGRPFGVLAWRTRDAASEYLWLVMGVILVVLIIWLAKRFVPQVF